MVNGTMVAIDKMGNHRGHKGGVVVNMSSICALRYHGLTPLYNATKHAVVSFVRSMKVIIEVSSSDEPTRFSKQRPDQTFL